MVIFEALVGCHDVPIMVKSPIKMMQRPDIIESVDRDIKHQFKQTDKKKTVRKSAIVLLKRNEISRGFKVHIPQKGTY